MISSLMLMPDLKLHCAKTPLFVDKCLSNPSIIIKFLALWTFLLHDCLFWLDLRVQGWGRGYFRLYNYLPLERERWRRRDRSRTRFLCMNNLSELAKTKNLKQVWKVENKWEAGDNCWVGGCGSARGEQVAEDRVDGGSETRGCAWVVRVIRSTGPCNPLFKMEGWNTSFVISDSCENPWSTNWSIADTHLFVSCSIFSELLSSVWFTTILLVECLQKLDSCLPSGHTSSGGAVCKQEWCPLPLAAVSLWRVFKRYVTMLSLVLFISDW